MIFKVSNKYNVHLNVVIYKRITFEIRYMD